MESMDQEDEDHGEQAMEMEDDDLPDNSRALKAGVGPDLSDANTGDDQEFAMPLFENGRYRNPWGVGAVSQPTMAASLMHLFPSKMDCKLPKKCELDKTLPVMKPDLGKFDSSPISGVRHLWIGHSTSLVQLDGLTILTDPMFSERCSIVQCMGHKRFRPTPCSISELPHIDLVLISHTHYDHLDYGSVMALNQRYGDNLRWYVPQGLMKWMRKCRCINVVEMTWWQEVVHSEDCDVRVVSTPSQHCGKRTAFDENKVLWCSWSIVGPNHSFFFAGDTAYCNVFKQIGKCYGPFTLATIPIGAYSPRSTMGDSNVDPEYAVNIHNDICSQASIGIHWGTFCLAEEPYLEPKQLLEQEIEKRRMKPCAFVTVNHGEITLVGSDGYNELD